MCGPGAGHRTSKGKERHGNEKPARGNKGAESWPCEANASAKKELCERFLRSQPTNENESERSCRPGTIKEVAPSRRR